jgi:hypothetical protein
MRCISAGGDGGDGGRRGPSLSRERTGTGLLAPQRPKGTDRETGGFLVVCVARRVSPGEQHACVRDDNPGYARGRRRDEGEGGRSPKESLRQGGSSMHA